jgi:hypothetical protein
MMKKIKRIASLHTMRAGAAVCPGRETRGNQKKKGLWGCTGARARAGKYENPLKDGEDCQSL